MKENLIKLAENLIFILIALAVLSIPLFFLPTTTEFFEYNKFAALFTLTIAGFLLWSLKMVLQGRAVFTRTPLDFPIIIFFIIYFVASLTSLDSYISIFGLHTKIWPSFLPLATIVAFFFLTVSNLKTKGQATTILWLLVLGTTVTSLVALSSYFGAYLPFEFAKIRSFNSLGSVHSLAILQAMIIPLTSLWAIYEKDNNLKIAATAVTLVLITSFIILNVPFAYVGLIAGIAALAILPLKKKLTKGQQGNAALLVIFAVLVLVVRFVPQVSQGTLYAWITTRDKDASFEQQIDTPKEKTLPLKAAWDIAASSIGKRPILGTGPGTYQFVYSQLKPRFINSTDNWPVRFEKSASFFTELIATVGIIGVLTFLIFAVALARFLIYLLVKSENMPAYLGLSAASVSILVNIFVTTVTFADFAAFFIILAALVTVAKINSEDPVYDVTVELAALKNRFAWLPLGDTQGIIKTETGTKGPKSQVLPVIFALTTIIISGYLAFNTVNAYRGEYLFRQSLLASRSNDGNRAVDFLQKAIAANGAVDTYHRTLSQTALNAAINLSRQKDLNDGQKQLLANLAQVAIDQGKVASGYQILPLRVPGISSANVANWESLSSAYQALIGSVNGSDTHAINTLAQAVALDPENPVLHYRLGTLYERLNNLDLAQRKYEDSIVVKGDLGPAHYSLASLLIQRNGDVARIVNELTFAKRFLPGDDPAREDIDKKLDEYNKKLRELQEKSASQSQQASPSPDASPSSSPSPSPTPSPSPSPSPSL